MKKLRSAILSLVALLTGLSGYSQQAPAGMLMNAYAFTPADMLIYSQLGYSFGTARSSAMGGAFTSLGGDLASIGMNPAGVGMYRSSVWGFSPSLMASDTRTDFSDTNGAAHTRFAFNNIGAVLSLSQNTGGVNIGFSYNKVADFNFRSSTTLPAGGSSIMDLFQLQLNGLGVIDYEGWHGIRLGALNDDPFWDPEIGINEWGAVLSYLTDGLSPVNYTSDNYLYRVGSIGNNSLITPSLAYDSRGSVGEYNMSLGMNFNSVFYLGLGMTIQDIFQRQEIGFSEEYDDNGISGDPGMFLKSMKYTQTGTMSGVGVNFKVGLVARPLPGLRVGLAVHTPTSVNITHEYVADMQTKFFMGSNNSREEISEVNIYDYSYISPTRLLTGISYTIGSVAAISVDYEKVFYNGMRLRGDDYTAQAEYRDHIKAFYRAADNVRAGIEVKPLPQLALRAGYSYYGSPFKHNDILTTRYVPTTTRSISAGLGIWLGPGTTLDLAYIFSKTNYADIALYSYQGEGFLPDADGNGHYVNDIDIAPSGPISGIKQKRHTFTMSFNFMF